MTPEHKVDVAAEAAKASPAVAVAAATSVFGFSLNEWVAIATLIYIILQAGWLVWKWYHAATDKRERKKAINGS